jgi:hypothetical protein
MTAKLYDIKEICQRLNASAASLAPELVPNLKRDGGQLRAGDLEGADGRSLCITVRGPYQGMWRDFASDDRGDMLDLIARTRTGGDKGAALKWARSWLQLDHEARPAPARPPRVNDNDAHQREGRRRAEALWWNGQPYAGSMAEEYDRGRGLFWHNTLGVYPPCARFHPAVYCVEVGHELPAMLLHITGPRGEHAAVQILWLERRQGLVTKAALAAPKKVWGSYKGNSIQVWPGAKQTLLADAEEGELAMIGEGYEDAATAALSRPEFRAIAAVGLSNMGHLFLPRQIKTVRLLMQNDPLEHPGHPGVPHPAQMMLYAAIRAHQYAGRVVELPRPPQGVKDFNDLVRRDRQ